MMKFNRRKWIRGFQITIAIYCTTGIVLWQLQDALLFHPTPLSASYKFQFELKHRELVIPLNATDRLDIVQFLPADTINVKGIVLYFHGNRENINRYAKYAPNFTKHGYEVWMIDYPGYGKTTGKRTEQRFYNDADLVYKTAAQRMDDDRILIYGKSLGTGIAAELASRRLCKHLFLETPYYSISSLAAFHFPIYPVKQMSSYQFPTYVFLASVKAPVTIFHGTHDRLIPYPHTLKLKKLLKEGDEFITIQKGEHNNLPEFKQYREKLDSLLKL
jgi:uncharacterized protein